MCHNEIISVLSSCLDRRVSNQETVANKEVVSKLQNNHRIFPFSSNTFHIASPHVCVRAVNFFSNFFMTTYFSVQPNIEEYERPCAAPIAKCGKMKNRECVAPKCFDRMCARAPRVHFDCFLDDGWPVHMELATSMSPVGASPGHSYTE